jgi:exodeoxyribonuclease V gamma subunit
MPLSIFSSNRVESLLENLCLRLGEATLADPLTSEVIVVPTYAMARWLNLKIARQQGIAANFDYPLPADWVWQLAASVLDQVPERDPLQAGYSSWKIFGLLPGMLKRPAFAPLQHYLLEDDAGIKRWQLATRIADVFERYQQYRPGLILDWCSGAGDDWQALLWRTLIVDHAQTHRVAVIQQLIESLNRNVDTSLLAERISLFAHSSLPPLFIQVVHALAQHTDITLYQHSPTDQYWADLKNKKSLSKLRLENPQQAEYFETGNDLLASWGRQGQALQDLLLNHDGLPVCESESYQAPERSTLLQSIQQNIFYLDDTAAAQNVDASLSIHVCHSPMRECQVLQDALLAMLDRDPSLNTEDILVMIPEISRYAPYIEAVFRSSENTGHPGLRWNLSDITLADEHPLVMTFLQLLKLPGSRFSRSEVLSYLDIDAIRQRFDIDDAALADIHSLLEESRVRWGIDEFHKTSLGLPATGENTWQQAKQRIFAGYALGEIEYWDGIAPIAEVDASRAQHLAKFWLLFERLQYWRDVLKSPCKTGEWQGRLNRMLDDFFVESNRQEDRLQSIRDAINDLNQAENLLASPALIQHWMEQQLASRQLQGRLFSGGITFCGMRPMRSLPFRVICLLGMNDGVFPRRENRIEFDAMGKSWQPGDPSKGDEDRYLMLETLLCARQVLYLSYCGRSLKDNSECQPSVLVRELLDFVDAGNADDSASGERFSHSLTTLHSMQAFAAKNFTPGTTSYDRYWCQIAKQIQAPDTTVPATTWASKTIAIDPDKERNINLTDLRRFLQDPIKFFFNRRLRLWLKSHKEDEDEEVFALNSLEKWGIKQRIGENLTRGRETSAQELQAQGRLPHGHAAYASFEAIESEIEPLLLPLQDYRGIAALSRTIDCQLDDSLRLSGQVGNYYAGMGLMHFNSSSMKGKHLLGLWLDHLALCASEQYQHKDSNRLITRDAELGFERLNSADAIDQLRDYGELYYRGLAYPLPIFPLSSYAWCCADNSEKAVKAASTAWYGNDYKNIPGDKDDNYIKLALRGSMQAPFTSTEFETYAQAFYANALKRRIEA